MNDDRPHYHDEIDQVGPPSPNYDLGHAGDDPGAFDPVDFEHWLVSLQTRRVESYLEIAQACLVAVENNDIVTAAKLFCQKAGWVKRRADVYALICDVFTEKDFLPQVPLSLYETAAKTADPRHWLRMATDPTYRQKITSEDDKLNVWSARHLTDMAGIAKGAKVSDVPLMPVNTEGIVVTWRDGGSPSAPSRIALDIPGWQPSGDRPVRVRLGKIVEILK